MLHSDILVLCVVVFIRMTLCAAPFISGVNKEDKSQRGYLTSLWGDHPSPISTAQECISLIVRPISSLHPFEMPQNFCFRRTFVRLSASRFYSKCFVVWWFKDKITLIKKKSWHALCTMNRTCDIISNSATPVFLTMWNLKWSRKCLKNGWFSLLTFTALLLWFIKPLCAVKQECWLSSRGT